MDLLEMHEEIVRLRAKCARQRTELRRMNKALLSWRRVAELAILRRMVQKQAWPSNDLVIVSGKAKNFVWLRSLFTRPEPAQGSGTSERGGRG